MGEVSESAEARTAGTARETPLHPLGGEDLVRRFSWITREDFIRAVESRDITITGKTWDDRVCCAYKAGLTEDEKVIFSLTRGISYSMQEANASLLKWVRAETYYRVSDGTADRDALAQKLDQLDSHLELWLAKFKNWIPPHPQHAIVFMADEEKHGIGFPKNLDEAVERMLAVEGQTFRRVIDTAAME